MRSTGLRPVCLLLVVICLLDLAGCISYEPSKHADSEAEPDFMAAGAVAESDWVKVRLMPLWQEDVAMRYLGIAPAKAGMLPAVLTVENRSQEPIKLDLARTCLRTTSGEQWFTVPVSEATSRALAEDGKTVDALALGVIPFSGLAYLSASDAYGKKSHSLEEDYHVKSFKPTLINGGSAGFGVVFFEFPQGTEAIPNLFYLPFSPEEGAGEIRVNLPADLFE